MIQNRLRESLFIDYRRVYWLPGCDAGFQFHDRVADPLPCLVVCGASSPASELVPLFFPFSISGRSLNDKTYDALNALNDVPPLHLHALFGYYFALCICGASASTCRGLDTRHLGMHRWEEPSTSLNLNELGVR